MLELNAGCFGGVRKLDRGRRRALCAWFRHEDQTDASETEHKGWPCPGNTNSSWLRHESGAEWTC
jgi:hypothetical protein